ncbi:hypothetical protein ES705_26868 [subsurface metagenome]
MAKEEQKYKHVQSLIFDYHGIITLNKKSNHFSYSLNLRGIINLPFYIIGVNWEFYLYDEDMGTKAKIFNYNDPLIFAQMQFVAQSTSDVFGDQPNLLIADSNWAHYNMSFQPGKVYDLTPFPIVVSSPFNYIMFDVFVDNSYTVVGALEWLPSFKLFIGIN